MIRVAAICLALGLSFPVRSQELLQPEIAFQPTAHYVDARTLEVRYRIAPGYYLYREKFAFKAGEKKLGKAKFPKGKIKDDPFFGRVEIYREALSIRLPVVQAEEGMTLEATSQGCADIGICYPPVTQHLKVLKP